MKYTEKQIYNMETPSESTGSRSRHLNSKHVTEEDQREYKNTQSGSHFEEEKGDDIVTTKRTHGPFAAISIISGCIIGSGIFVSPKGILQGTGSPGLSLCVWVLTGVLAVLGGLCMIELGLFIPLSGGMYTYVRESLGRPLAFLVTWIHIWVVHPSSMAIKCSLSAQYILSPLFPACGAPTLLVSSLATVLVSLLVGLNCYSIKWASRLQIVLTSVKIISLALISVVGIINLATGQLGAWEKPFENNESNLGKIALAFYSGSFAYGGWANLNYVAEEIKKPEINMPRGVLVGVSIVIVLYLLVNVSYFTALSPEELLQSPAVAVSWANNAVPSLSWLFPIFVSISTLGSLNGSILCSTREIYVASRDGMLPQLLGMIHIKHRSPIPSIFLATLISIIMMFTSGLQRMIEYTSFASWTIIGLALISLLKMRYTRRDVPRPYTVPTIIPILVLLTAVYLVLAPIINDPQIHFLVGVGFMVVGMLFYLVFNHWGCSIPGTGYVTIFCQNLMQVSPPTPRCIQSENQPIALEVK